jgi:putative oxidoreductase
MDRLEGAIMFGLNVPLARWAPQMLGVLRIFVALLYLQSGLSKYFGFPAPPPANFTAFSLMGLAGVIEIVGSLLLLVGLFTREAAFIMSGEMAVAYFKVRAPLGFFPLLNNGRLDALFCFVFLYFVFAGPGAWSLDGLRQSSKRPSFTRP